LDANGPWGLNPGFYQNAVAEIGGFILGAIVFSIFIPVVIDWRQARKWKPARQNFGQELLLLHVAFGEALLLFVRTAATARGRVADAVDHAFRAFPTLTGLYGYALDADISREVNDYMRVLRGIRDWAYEAAHPEDLNFAAVERRVHKTREMFEHANKEFKDVLEVLDINGYEDVHWKREVIGEFAAAFDESRTHRKH
jgi:hypothetical protein